MHEISVFEPKPFSEVGAEFQISGWVPLSWLKSEHALGFWNDVLLDLIDIKGQTISGSSIYIPRVGLLARILRGLAFSSKFQFSQFNVEFIKASQGRMTIKLAGRGGKEQRLYIPIVVKELEPEGGPDPEVVLKHKNIGKMIEQYESDLEIYNAELQKIDLSRKAKNDGKTPQYIIGPNASIAFDILKILEETDDQFDEYTYSEEDRREKELETRYKDALEWRGPLFRGLVSQINGFELRVNSGDHNPPHFHVIYSGKGIDARFSFPDIRLMSYKKGRTTISSKQERLIREHCLRPEVFRRFEMEFQKQVRT
jgi:hypothetical protein